MTAPKLTTPKPTAPKPIDNADWPNPWATLDQQAPSEENRMLPSQHIGSTRCIFGTLCADHLTIEPSDSLTVVSGSGNVDYGQGQYDILDLSDLPISAVTQWIDATTSGVLFNPGNGARMFDAICLSNGHQILFEGIDAIQFSDRTIYLSVCPNDPRFYEQWNLHIMGVQNAWRFTQGNADVLIGIQDTGLAYSHRTRSIHPDLSTPLSFSRNLADDFSGSARFPCSAQMISHGTRVQSIISAVSNNGEGISGINWNASVAHADVIGGDAEDMTLAQATRFMLNLARRRKQGLVINLSLCSAIEEEDFNELVRDNQENILFIVAAGNGNQSQVSYPAALAKQYKNIIAVGAAFGKTESQRYEKLLGDRAQYQTHSGSNYGPGLSLMGPSKAITAVGTKEDVDVLYDNLFTGTSAAAPNITGVASLVWSICPQLSAAQVHYVLSETAYRNQPDSDSSDGYSLETGYGFVCADAAVRRAIAIQRYLAPARAITPLSTRRPAQFKLAAPYCKMAS